MVEVVKVVTVVGVAEVSLELRLAQLEGCVDPSSSKKTILRINTRNGNKLNYNVHNMIITLYDYSIVCNIHIYV